MEKITIEKWENTHKDYKGVVNGVAHILKFTEKGTCSVPVEIVNEEKIKEEIK